MRPRRVDSDELAPRSRGALQRHDVPCLDSLGMASSGACRGLRNGQRAGSQQRATPYQLGHGGTAQQSTGARIAASDTSCGEPSHGCRSPCVGSHAAEDQPPTQRALDLGVESVGLAEREIQQGVAGLMRTARLKRRRFASLVGLALVLASARIATATKPCPGGATLAFVPDGGALPVNAAYVRIGGQGVQPTVRRADGSLGKLSLAKQLDAHWGLYRFDDPAPLSVFEVTYPRVGHERCGRPVSVVAVFAITAAAPAPVQLGHLKPSRVTTRAHLEQVADHAPLGPDWHYPTHVDFDASWEACATVDLVLELDTERWRDALYDVRFELQGGAATPPVGTPAVGAPATVRPLVASVRGPSAEVCRPCKETPSAASSSSWLTLVATAHVPPGDVVLSTPALTLELPCSPAILSAYAATFVPVATEASLPWWWWAILGAFACGGATVGLTMRWLGRSR